MNRRCGRAALRAARALGHQRPTGFRGSQREPWFRSVSSPSHPPHPIATHCNLLSQVRQKMDNILFISDL